MSVFVPPPASEAGEIDEAFLGTVYDEGRMFALHNEDIAVISASSDPALASLRERLAEAQQRIERDRVIVAYAHTFGHQEHVVEIDANAAVSEQEQAFPNGAWVSAWVWVPFDGTALDTRRECEKCGALDALVQKDGKDLCRECYYPETRKEATP